MSDDQPAENTPAEAQAQPAPETGTEAEPEWKSDPYLTSGARFRRWNLITLILGLLALGGGWMLLAASKGAQASGQ